MTLAAFLLMLTTTACRPAPPEAGPDDDPVRTIGGERPAQLVLPRHYDGEAPIPLVVVLHGFTSNAFWTNRYFGIGRRVDRDTIAVVLPNGTRDPQDRSFWNATDYCCDFHQSGVNDVGYLNGLVQEAGEHMAVEGVYLVGLSNGGFMSYRMACESMPGLRAIAPVAGMTFHDPQRCEGARPVSVLHVHGTADETIRYDGGGSDERGRYPSAPESARRWAERAGCDVAAARPMDALDLVGGTHPETEVMRYEAGCPDGIKVDLWTIEEGPHVPGFDADDFGARVVAWFLGG